MNLEEATELAIELKRSRPTWTVVAIGRFIPVAQIKPDSPIGISVHVPGEISPRVIWNRKEVGPPSKAGPQKQVVEAMAANSPGFLF